MKFYILCSSVTYALKSKRELLSRGIGVYLKKPPRQFSDCGCGYVVEVDERDIDDALDILRETNINVKSVYRLDDDGMYRRVK